MSIASPSCITCKFTPISSAGGFLTPLSQAPCISRRRDGTGPPGGLADSYSWRALARRTGPWHGARSRIASKTPGKPALAGWCFAASMTCRIDCFRISTDTRIDLARRAADCAEIHITTGEVEKSAVFTKLNLPFSVTVHILVLDDQPSLFEFLSDKSGSICIPGRSTCQCTVFEYVD